MAGKCKSGPSAQTGKIKNFPIVIMGAAYWKELIDFINKMAEFGMINEADVRLVYATDSVGEAIEHIRTKAIEPFGLRLTTRIRRHLPWLGEHALSKSA
jgi:predicted Rossmann-fold nucleotide-binding protein